MPSRPPRLPFGGRLRTSQRQIETLTTDTEKFVDRYLFKRFDRLFQVRRFVTAWMMLIVLLIGAVITQNIFLSNYYQTLQTVPGGIYTEGVRGRFTNANPIYATSDADQTVSRLVFAGLLAHDDKGALTGDLAANYSVDARGTTYTVHLRPNLVWQDGQPLTSEDVAFTYHAIQNADAQSPLQSSWQGITVTATDPLTVTFKLPGILASFPTTLTNGIVPAHILAKIPAADLRSSDFNTLHPVGAGPFTWQAIELSNDATPQRAQEQVALVPFAAYHAGQPKLQKFVVHVFGDQRDMEDAFRANRLTGMEGLTELPPDLQHKASVIQHSLPLEAATMVFFKTSKGVLSDTQVRQSLVQAANVPQIISSLSYPVRQVREPILRGQVGYDAALVQPQFDLKAAQAKLTADGWIMGGNGIRSKDGKPLTFTLTASDNRDYHVVGSALQKQWRTLGVKVDVQYLEPGDLQNAVTYHTYDAILNGISIGTDPDVFVYWDSSQADIRATNRLNLSEYKNTQADIALEAGRTRLDPELRTIKYRPFLQAWQQDAPALGLYQPRVLYATNGYVSGLDDRPITAPIDRFVNVNNWQIKQTKVTD